jgi:hypothetical protein
LSNVHGSQKEGILQIINIKLWLFKQSYSHPEEGFKLKYNEECSNCASSVKIIILYEQCQFGLLERSFTCTFN